MLREGIGVRRVYLACGYTNLRQGIDGLVFLVQQQFGLNPFDRSLFLFCGRRRDRIKGLLFEGDGFLLLYKRLEHGRFRCPMKPEQVRPLSRQEYRWLMEGLTLDPKQTIKETTACLFL